jgi:type IV secretory pathway TraG/TraD family ATPase VirD4
MAPVIDLRAAIESRAVVYFALESDRLRLLGEMLGVAIVCDLVVAATYYQHDPVDTVVLIDEFSAIGAGHVARLFARARGAGISLVLATQELADLQTAGEGLREQVLGNLDALVAHRQNVPASAELIADVAGTRPVWATTQGIEEGLLGSGPSGRGTRRREYEREVHPSEVMRLGRGQALVVTKGEGGRAVLTRMCHPGA